MKYKIEIMKYNNKLIIRLNNNKNMKRKVQQSMLL